MVKDKNPPSLLTQIGKQIAALGPYATLAAITHYYLRTNGAYPTASAAGKERAYFGLEPVTRSAAAIHIKKLAKKDNPDVVLLRESKNGRVSGFTAVLLPFALSDMKAIRAVIKKEVKRAAKNKKD